MFGRNVRTRLHLMVRFSKQSPIHTILLNKKSILKHRILHPGDRVQVLNYNKRGEKLSFGNVLSKERNAIYNKQMDNDTIWRRHRNQILPRSI